MPSPHEKTFRVRREGARFCTMKTPRLLCLALCFSIVALQAAEPEVVATTPKLENLTKQIAANDKDAQAYANRGYVLALLGRKEDARADIKKSVEIKDDGPMHNRAGWAYFNLGDYDAAVREFETAVKFSNLRSHYDYYSLVLGYWGTGKTKLALENYQLAVERDPRFGEYKTLNERTAEWTPVERKAIHEVYVLWSKTWKP
jgi:tetratricopeptide (TPR) repeat protein